jgi:hypothetical protein
MEMSNSPRNVAQVAFVPLSPNVATVAPETIADKVKAARIREMGLDLARKRRVGRKRSRPSLGLLMLRQLEQFLSDTYDKHGPAMPEGDDAASEHFVVLLHLIANLGDPSAMWAAKARWRPWMDEEAFTDILDQIERKPRRWRADSLAREIGLDYATRARLGITSIGASDFSKAKRVALRTAKDIKRKRVGRAAAGAKPHALSAARLKPWLALGISKATYDRRRKLEREANSATAAFLFHAAETASPVQGASPSGDLARSDPAGVDVLVAEPAAAAGESQSVIKRDAAGAGRLGLHWIENSKKPFDIRPLAALTSTEMGRAAA